MLSKLKRSKIVRGGKAPEVPGAVPLPADNPTHKIKKFGHKIPLDFIRKIRKTTMVVLIVFIAGVLGLWLLIKGDQPETADPIDIPEYTELSPELKEKLKTDLEEGPPGLKDQPIPYTE